jgi:hypothetical protein
MSTALLLALLTVGVTLVAVGVGLVYLPAGLVVLGLACVGVAVRVEVSER